jgi:hypothetical protein
MFIKISWKFETTFSNTLLYVHGLLNQHLSFENWKTLLKLPRRKIVIGIKLQYVYIAAGFSCFRFDRSNESRARNIKLLCLGN